MPYRYDLQESSQENRNIKRVNTKIRKLCAANNIKVLDMWSLPRGMHTGHGLHLNMRGRREVARSITSIIAHHPFFADSSPLVTLSSGNRLIAAPSVEFLPMTGSRGLTVAAASLPDGMVGEIPAGPAVGADPVIDVRMAPSAPESGDPDTLSSVESLIGEHSVSWRTDCWRAPTRARSVTPTLGRRFSVQDFPPLPLVRRRAKSCSSFL